MIDAPWYQDPVETLAFNMYAFEKENGGTADNALLKAAAANADSKAEPQSNFWRPW